MRGPSVKILVVKMSSLGDVVQSLPALSALREAFPEAQIHWVVEETSADLLRLHPGVDRIWIVPRARWVGYLRRPGRWTLLIREAVGTARALRGHRFDLALDLQGLLKSAMWMRVARADRKVGFDGAREGASRFLTEKYPWGHPDRHAVERYLGLVEGISRWRGAVDYGVILSHDVEVRALEELRLSGGVPDQPWVVLIPAARWRTKEWHPRSFAWLADEIVRRTGLQVLFAGGTGDRFKIGEILDQMTERGIDLTGKTDIPVLAALLKRARVVVSVDTGPMHLAVAVGTPVVALFGPTAPWRTGPFGRGHRVLRPSLPCSPCFQRRCSRRACMREIDPEAVLRAVCEALA
jgi:lipopolysaccharide heptosyltransferase I